jgi:putative transposase
LSRKQKGSRNREKARLKVARIQQQISDSRKDHLHKLTTRLIRENQTIAVECAGMGLPQLWDAP